MAERRSFVHAAALVHLSQPAVSTQIQQLEQELGVRLLNRESRAVKLTKAGEVFLAGARATLAQAEEAVRAVKRAAQNLTNRIRLGFPPSALNDIMPAIVAEFHKLHPQVKLELNAFHTSMVIGALQNEVIDIGYVRLPVQAKGLKILPMHQEPLVVCLPKSHALANVPRIKLADLRNEKFIMYGRKWAPGFHDRIVDLCTQAGFSPTVVDELDEMYIAPTLVAVGVGIAILPKMVVSVPTENVVARDLSDVHAISEIGIATRSTDQSPFIASIASISRFVGMRCSMQQAG